jgi:hypothetical protein
MPVAAQLFAPVWLALPLTGSSASVRPASRADIDPAWHPLGQHWRPAPEPGLNPGWARIRWDFTGLFYEALFLQCRPANRARRLNERTWELGDIAEFFLQLPGGFGYWEFHVTPENQRLQLQWPAGGLAAFRAGRAAFEEFTLGPDAGLSSTATVGPDCWRATLTIPASVLGLAGFSSGQSFRTTVCRYDCAGAAEPVCSSTAPLHEPAFHRPAEWSILTLSQP